MGATVAAALPRLMLVTDRRRTRGRDLVELVVQAVAGGVGLVQLRERDLADAPLAALALRLRSALPPGTPLVVNDRPRLAAELGLGLHLSASAPPLARPPGDGRLAGRSAHDDAEAWRARQEGASYVVLGTIYPSASKPGGRAAGIALVERVCRQIAPLPVYAIGGMTVTRIPPLIHAGAHGVAVCGALLSASDPGRVAEAMVLALDVSRRGQDGG